MVSPAGLVIIVISVYRERIMIADIIPKIKYYPTLLAELLCMRVPENSSEFKREIF